MSEVVTIDFRGDALYAVKHLDGVVVAVKPICEALGLAWRKQLERLKRDPILAEGITMMVIPSAGGAQETICLRLDLVHGWLFTIDESRVKNEAIRRRVLDYKRDCYRVLFEHFQSRRQGDLSQAAIVEPAEAEGSVIGPVAELRAKTGLVNTCRVLYGLPAAQWMWETIGLPSIPAGLRPQVRGSAGAATVEQAVARFLAERTVRRPGARVQSSFLYRFYTVWARQCDMAPCTQVAFSRAMRRLGIPSHVSHVVYWLDLHCMTVPGRSELGSIDEAFDEVPA